MHVGRAAAALHRLRDVAEVAILAAACDVRPAEANRFLLSFLGPRPGQQVVGVCIARQKIHWDHAELQRGSPLQKQHLVVRRDAADLTAQRFALFVNGQERFAAMRVLADTDAGVSQRKKILASLLQDRHGQHSRAG